jgi:hypothetical protein
MTREMDRRFRQAAKGSACARDVDELPSLKRAAFWHRMYRRDLYRETDREMHLRGKLNRALERARPEIDALMKKHRVKSFFLGNMKNGECLGYVPSWKDAPWGEQVKEGRLRRRWWFWEKSNPEWAEMWRLKYTAVAHLREKSWPLSPAAIRRARNYLIAEHDRQERDRLIAEASAERRAEEEAQRQRRLELEIANKANGLLAELVPEIRVTKRMRKAQAFDVLVQLLEKSDVDPKTKEAIGRLRDSVEDERGAAGGLHRGSPPAAARHDGRRHQVRSGQAVPSADV